MFSGSALILWLLLPPMAWIFRDHIPWRVWQLKPAHLYFTILIAGTILYVAHIWLVAAEQEYVWRRFDLDGDRELSPEESTPAALEAMRTWSSDAGRRIAAFFAAPVTLVYVSLWFAILGAAKWIRQRLPGQDRSRVA